MTLACQLLLLRHRHLSSHLLIYDIHLLFDFLVLLPSLNSRLGVGIRLPSDARYLEYIAYVNVRHNIAVQYKLTARSAPASIHEVVVFGFHSVFFFERLQRCCYFAVTIRRPLEYVDDWVWYGAINVTQHSVANQPAF